MEFQPDTNRIINFSSWHCHDLKGTPPIRQTGLTYNGRSVAMRFVRRGGNGRRNLLSFARTLHWKRLLDGSRSGLFLGCEQQGAFQTPDVNSV